MMKKLIKRNTVMLTTALSIITTPANAQFHPYFDLNITAKVTDKTNTPLERKIVAITVEMPVYGEWKTKTVTDTTDENGEIKIYYNPTQIREKPRQFTHDYTVSNNYPNPFSTSISWDITTSASSNLEIIIYNTLGQKITEQKQQVYSGENKSTINLEGLASGIYIARIIVGNKYFTDKKILHIATEENSSNTGNYNQIYITPKQETYGNTNTAEYSRIDSVKISGIEISTTRYITNIATYEQHIDFGTFTVDSSFANLSLQLYDLYNWRDSIGISNAQVRITNNNWTKDDGTTLDTTITTDENGRISISGAFKAVNEITIEAEGYWTYKTKIIVSSDTTVALLLMNKNDVTQDVLDKIYNYVLRVYGPRDGYLNKIFTPKTYHIRADMTIMEEKDRSDLEQKIIKDKIAPLTQTITDTIGVVGRSTINIDTTDIQIYTPDGSYIPEGYFQISWVTGTSWFARTHVWWNEETGEVLSGEIEYQKEAYDWHKEKLIQKEQIHLLHGKYAEADPYDNLKTVFDMGVPEKIEEWDKACIQWMYNRPTTNHVYWFIQNWNFARTLAL